MKKKVILLILVFLSIPYLLTGQEVVVSRLAVLPFEVFSISGSKGLDTEVARQLTQQLELSGAILTVDFKAVQNVLEEDDRLQLTDNGLRELAKLLNANFIVFGSLTQIGEDISIDVQLFNNFSSDPYYKTFSEGTELDAAVEDVALKISQEVALLAGFIPPAQRPKVSRKALKGRKKDADTTGDDGDLARELGFEEEMRLVLEEEEEKPVAEPEPEADTEEPSEEEESALEEETLEETPDDEEPSDEADDDVEPSEEEEDEEEGSEAVAAGEEYEEEGDEDEETEEPRKTEKKKRRQKAFAFDQPININADSLEYDNKNNSATFTGNVVARQGGIVIFADRVKGVYSPKGGLKRLYASGNVKIIQGDRIATGQKITFYNDKQKIVATGFPRVWQGDNVIQGKKITVLLKEDRYIVEGSPTERVTATLQPKKKKNKK